MDRLLRKLARALGLLALPALLIGAVLALIHRDPARVDRQGRRDESENRALEAARAPLFARRELRPVLSLCQGLWRDELKLYFEPAALAWTPDAVDAYFLEGTDRNSLRQVHCSARGVSRGPRVTNPTLSLLPAEAPPAPVEATPAPAELPRSSGVATDAGGALHLDLAALPVSRLAPDDLAVEFLADPRGVLLSRRWRGAEGGVTATTEPAAAPPFPLLIVSPTFRVPAPTPPTLQHLARHHWPAEPEAAFALIEAALPRGALVSEIQLEDDQISLYVASPTPAFDGKPPVPYGEKEFDEYGVAQTEWWYPREIAGFGCPTGQPLASVRAAFADAKSRFASRPVASAWYSCSTAYSDGRHGAWHLQTR